MKVRLFLGPLLGPQTVVQPVNLHLHPLAHTVLVLVQYRVLGTQYMPNIYPGTHVQL